MLPIIATPKKAWNPIVAISRISRKTYGGRCGPGSTPQITEAKRSPLSRKCTVIRRCPVWVRSASSKSGE